MAVNNNLLGCNALYTCYEFGDVSKEHTASFFIVIILVKQQQKKKKQQADLYGCLPIL
jgi:hypothetical protein